MSRCYGRGEAIGHVGEILQGAIRLNGKLEAFLITLPAPSLHSTAVVNSASEWQVSPGWKLKALAAAQTAAHSWNWDRRAHLSIDSNIPVGRGYGSSTADCAAAIRALGSLLDRSVSDDEVAQIAVRAEGACDATIYGLQPAVILPRHGRRLSVLRGRWPELRFDIEDLGGPPVETLATTLPEYTELEIEEFEELLSAASAAFADEDCEALGAIALRSATIHQRHRPHPAWPAIERRARADGALGLARSHSGTAVAILWKARANECR